MNTRRLSTKVSPYSLLADSGPDFLGVWCHHRETQFGTSSILSTSICFSSDSLHHRTKHNSLWPDAMSWHAVSTSLFSPTLVLFFYCHKLKFWKNSKNLAKKAESCETVSIVASSMSLFSTITKTNLSRVPRYNLFDASVRCNYFCEFLIAITSFFLTEILSTEGSTPLMKQDTGRSTSVFLEMECKFRKQNPGKTVPKKSKFWRQISNMKFAFWKWMSVFHRVGLNVKFI